MRQSMSEALEWIRNHPAEFLRLTLMRAVYFWCGPLRRPLADAAVTAVTILALLGLRRTLPALTTPHRAAFLIPLGTFPLVYYFVSYVPHYRAPLEWMLLLLAGAEVWHWIRWRALEAWDGRSHSLASPKSRILASPRPVTKMLAGLMSR